VGQLFDPALRLLKVVLERHAVDDTLLGSSVKCGTFQYVSPLADPAARDKPVLAGLDWKGFRNLVKGGSVKW
jgi:hypothetical protein